MSDETLTIRTYGSGDLDGVVALWTACGLVVPWNDPAADIALATSRPSSTILLGHLGERLAASVMVGHDGHRGWFYYLAVDPAFRRNGYGRSMIGMAESWLAAVGIPKAMLMVRNTNTGVIGFYERLGYEPTPSIVMQKWLKTS